VLELRRSARADLYDLFQDAPATLFRAAAGVESRNGSAPKAPSSRRWPKRDRSLIEQLRKRRGFEAVAVSFLFSFLTRSTKAGSRRAARGAAGRAGLFVVRLLPEIKEFERSSTTAVLPMSAILAAYIKRLATDHAREALPRCI